MKSILKLAAFVLVTMLLSVMAFALPTSVGEMDNGMEVFYEYDVVEELMDEGVENDPYMISTPELFNYYAKLIKSNNALYGDKYYKLACNIDFDGAVIVPFGTKDTPFKGTLDGDGYALKNVKIAGEYYSGVIGYMTQGAVKNLSVHFLSDGLSRSDKVYFGGIAGHIEPAAGKNITISGCETNGDIHFDSKKAVYGGGIAGYIKCSGANVTVTDCVSRMSIDVDSSWSGYLGGMVAYAIASSSKNYIFNRCVSYGDLSYSNTDFVEATVGGFAGYTNKDMSGWTDFASEDAALMATTYNFENCVAFGDVYGSSLNKVMIGGFAADLAGEGKVEFKDCFVPAGQSVEGDGEEGKVVKNSDGASVKSLETLSDETFYSSLGYDFGYDWYMSGNGLVPRTTAKQHGAATVLSSVSLRLKDYRPGLRFTVEIDAEKRAYCYEYGFLIATKEAVGDGELTFDTYPCAVGIAYADDVDVIYSKTDDKITFTGVLYNISEKYYSTDVVFRSYVSYECDGEIVTVYGNSVSANLGETALKYYTNEEIVELLTPRELEILESMLPKA